MLEGIFMTCRRSSKEMIFFNIPWLSQTAPQINMQPKPSQRYPRIKNVKYMVFFFFRQSLKCQITIFSTNNGRQQSICIKTKQFPVRLITFLPYYLNWKTTNMPSSHQIFLYIFFASYISSIFSHWMQLLRHF